MTKRASYGFKVVTVRHSNVSTSRCACGFYRVLLASGGGGGGDNFLHFTLLDIYSRLIDDDCPIVVSRNVSGNDIGSLVELRPCVLARNLSDHPFALLSFSSVHVARKFYRCNFLLYVHKGRKHKYPVF